MGPQVIQIKYYHCTYTFCGGNFVHITTPLLPVLVDKDKTNFFVKTVGLLVMMMRIIGVLHPIFLQRG